MERSGQNALLFAVSTVFIGLIVGVPLVARALGKSVQFLSRVSLFSYPVHPNSTDHFQPQQHKTVADLLDAHKQWQAASLHQVLHTNAIAQVPPVVAVRFHGGGWGNRLPSLVTGLLMAVFTGRVFMLQPDHQILDFLSFAWDVDWAKYAHLYGNASQCNIDYNKLAHPDLQWCLDPSSTVSVMWYQTRDYDVPLLSINPSLEARLKQLFPDGSVFHIVAPKLFQFSQTVLQAARPYRHEADQCLVGLQIRMLKHGEGWGGPIDSPHNFTMQFAGIARAITKHQPGSVFVAADTDVFPNLTALLPGRKVWWSNLTQSTVASQSSAGGNPGTDLSAFVDLYLLSRCKEIVLTAGSSFGQLASAYVNVVPVYAIRGYHPNPFYTPWFWKALSSEPHSFKLSKRRRHRLRADVFKSVQERHPRMFELEQLNF